MEINSELRERVISELIRRTEAIKTLRGDWPHPFITNDVVEEQPESEMMISREQEDKIIEILEDEDRDEIKVIAELLYVFTNSDKIKAFSTVPQSPGDVQNAFGGHLCGLPGIAVVLLYDEDRIDDEDRICGYPVNQAVVTTGDEDNENAWLHSGELIEDSLPNDWRFEKKFILRVRPATREEIISLSWDDNVIGWLAAEYGFITE